MLYWIFDLDYTLYNLDKKEEFNYDKLVVNKNIQELIKNLPSKKLLFTNGTYYHAFRCLKKMDIYQDFDKIVSRDCIKSLKPSPISYIKFMFVCDISNKDMCIFFDDSIKNLINAKQLKWITVLIDKNLNKNVYVDFVFPNIEKALLFFKDVIK